MNKKNNHNLNKYTVSSKLGETKLSDISLGFPEISRFIHKRDGPALFTTDEKLCMVPLKKFSLKKIIFYIFMVWAKGDWDFRISDLVKNPDGTDI